MKKRTKRVFDHSGSSFQSFLKEEGMKEDVEAAAIQRVVAWQLQHQMLLQGKTKHAVARELPKEAGILRGPY